MINVDFDFYNLNPDVDQYVPSPPLVYPSDVVRLMGRMAVKRLLRQTLSHDDEMIDVHPLAELILSEGVRLAAGSSIKTDGEESDPWGLVGIVDIAKHRVSPFLLTAFPTSRLLITSLFTLLAFLITYHRPSHPLAPIATGAKLIDRKTQP
jgi:protein BCP1